MRITTKMGPVFSEAINGHQYDVWGGGVRPAFWQEVMETEQRYEQGTPECTVRLHCVQW